VVVLEMNHLCKCLLIALIIPAGCKTNESKIVPVRPADDKGSVVYVYRPNSFSNVIISPGLIIDGKERFLISNNKYTFVYVSPGKHAFKLNLDGHYHGDFERLLDVKPGQAYFLRVDTSMKFVQGQPYIRSFDLKEVTGEVSLSDVEESKYMKPEMPSKYLWKKDESGQEPRFTTDKTSDPFSRNK